ncbi:uncharacterized protein At5g49945 [Phalaenopsis equestris]|uniref:uncharacterized protein At5g49945 n=1 Tax=Phalaenopsis equestris TaxID=78828 RepID=UPI0009E3D556|nr:uncharacterized protein At5g49945 [Phalaenopsis equestris]
MGKLSSSRWSPARPAYLFSRRDGLLFLFAIISVICLVTNELSRNYVLAADFEGFDTDEFEYDEDTNDAIHSQTLNPASPSATTLTQSSEAESHHVLTPPSAVEDSPAVGIEHGGKPHASSALEFWDDEEFEGVPFQIADPSRDSPVPPSEPSAYTEAVADTRLPTPHQPFSLSSYTIEIVCISFLIAFAVNFFIGKRQNELIALCWASQFATKDSIFVKNFSLLGTGDGKEDAPLLLKEGQDVFKFYASGRRFCQGLLAIMELQSRHDLIARLTDLLFNKKDTITFEVVMNEDAMDHVILAVARKKMAKSMHKESRDLQRFATVMTTTPSGRKWVAEDLVVVTESKEVAGDLITDAVIDQVLGEKAFDKVGKGFISFHFSDQHPGSRKKLLILKFALPGVNNMAEMTRLVNLVPYYIDLIGRYKPSSQARAKTEAARAKAAQEAFKEMQSERQETLQKKKAEKKKLVEEAEAKLSAEAIRKKEEKERSRQMKKLMPKVKMLRSH